MKRQNSQLMMENITLSRDGLVDSKAARLNFQNGNAEVKIDEALYSRQLYVLGHESMRKMSTSSVLISGMDGLGAEIAKNLILAGVRCVVLHDTKVVTPRDLSSQFYLNESDVGRNRAEACYAKFEELNSYVAVEHSQCDLANDYVKEFQVVILCNYLSQEVIASLSTFCHEADIKFILASTRGLFGQIFCDFGRDFQVLDADGEEPAQSVVESITYDTEDGIVTLSDHGQRGFCEGDFVKFRDIRGAAGLNTCGPVRIKSVISPFCFSIGDTTRYGGAYESGGIASQLKRSQSLSFKSYSESLVDPEILTSDFAKIERQFTLHTAFQCIGSFCSELLNNSLPKPRNVNEAEMFVKFCKHTIKSQDLDEDLLKEFASQCCGDICPMNAVIGGICAQEAIKSISGKFTPLKQWLYFDALECLPIDHRVVLNEEECKPIDESRYNAEIAVFGRKFVEKLRQQKIFLVGAGALGCEMLKNWAMMGVACNPEGRVTVTDNDLIERSNLNRQFLFRPSDLQQPKSDRAAEACRRMNPAMNLVAHRNRVGPETEEVYNDEFFLGLNLVVNALDNIEARKYVDGRCVHFHRPLLESGTLGTKGNIQVILPGLTESYSSSTDPPEKSYPICTIKNFPYAIEHTLQWARELFDTCFKAPMFHVLQYINEPQFFEGISDASQLRSIIGAMKRTLAERPRSFHDCVVWARKFWQESFYNQTAQILYSFPADAVTSEGVKFWSGTKRLPRLIEFNVNNPWHLNFVIAGANLRAQIFGIPQVRDSTKIVKMLSTVDVDPFEPRTGSKVTLSDDETHKSSESSDVDEQAKPSITDLLVSLPPRESLSPCHFESIDFEKDDDTNFHMDFIVAASNSRAEVYDIPPADRHKSKGIAGRIIPAIATTTSVVVGLVCLELYKIIQNHRNIELFKNGFINLALPLFAFSEPLPPRSNIFNGKKWTLWDRFVVKGEPTLGELIDLFQNEHKAKLTMVSCGVAILYTDLMDHNKQRDRKVMTPPRILELVTGKELAPWQRILTLDVCSEDAEGNDEYEMPSIHYVIEPNRIVDKENIQS